MDGVVCVLWWNTWQAHQNSASMVNFCISVGDARYRPCPRLLKQNVFAILQNFIKMCSLLSFSYNLTIYYCIFWYYMIVSDFWSKLYTVFNHLLRQC